MGVLIGPRGSTQKRLEADSGCKVLIRGKGAQRQDDSRFDHETAQEPLHVLIVGKNEADAKRGEQLVRDILFDPQIAMNLKRQQLGGHVMNNMSNGGAGGLRPDQDPHPIELNVPDNVVGFIIGHRGENIRKIQMESGAHVQVIRREEMPPGSQGRAIYIRGTDEAKKRARILIDNAMQHTSHPSGMSGGMGGGVTIYLKLPDDRIGLVIGKGGMTIRHIQLSTGSNIQIPKMADADDPTVRTATISGPDQATCQRAQDEMLKYINQTEISRGIGVGPTLEVEVPDHKCGLIIGRQGSTISQLQYQFQCHIQIPNQANQGSDPPVRTITISGGHPNSQTAVRDEILKLITNDPRDGGQGHYIQSAYAQQGSGGYGGGYYQQQQQYGYGGGYYQQQQQQQPHQQYPSSAPTTTMTSSSDKKDENYNAVPPPGSSTTTTSSSNSSSKVAEQPQYDEATRIAAWKAYYAQQQQQQQYYQQYYQQQQHQPPPPSGNSSSAPPPPGPPGGK